MSVKTHDKFLKTDKQYTSVPEIEIRERLNPGSYLVTYDQRSGKVFFDEFTINGDTLIDIPHTEYDGVKKEVDYFLTKECKDAFKDYGFLYKRNILLYGQPGVGKTCLVNRIAQQVVRDGGVVLFNPEPHVMPEIFKIFDNIQPETRTMVIFEELDEILKVDEESLLSILDGEIQKENIIYVATTNYIDRIHPRIRRPGRFASVVEVGFPNAQARGFYLNYKMKLTGSELNSWIEKTNGFSIDELKETVLAVKCLKQDLNTVLNRVKDTKGIAYTGSKNRTNKLPMNYLDDEDEDGEGN